MNKLKKFCLISFFGFFISSLTVHFSYALPTFARKYQTSCTTCHVSVPKLGIFGERFRLNGYQIPEGDNFYLRENPVSLGAPGWKEVWPKGIWPGAIPGSFPLSLWSVFDLSLPLKGENREVSFEFPHELELFMAGTMGEDVPFFVEVEWEQGSISAEAWIGFYNLFQLNRGLNLRIGSFEINPLPFVFDHLKLGREHFLYSNWRIPGSKNDFRLRGGKMGFELNGIIANRISYGAGVVSPKGGLDSYLTLRFKLGGTPFGKIRMLEEGENNTNIILTSGFWEDNALELAAFAYSGRADVQGIEPDNFNRLGTGIRWTYKNIDISSSYFIGKNSDPYGEGTEVNASGWLIEGSYYLYPWLIAEARYESLRFDNSSILADQKQTIAGLIIMLRANIKLITEVVMYSKTSGKNDQVQMRLLFGF